MRTIKTWLATIAVLLCSVSASAQNFEVNGIMYYVTSEQEVQVFDETEILSGDVVIPETVTYNGITYNVTSIGSSAFEGCSSLTALSIPNSVTEIGYSAFHGCSSMASVNIPTGVKSIHGQTFWGCSSLESIIIPFTVTSIDNYAFMGCSSLTSITIPKSVTEIRQFTFAGCTNLTSIIVESGNTKYDSRNNCNAIIETKTNTLIQGCSSTIIPSSVTSIGNYAFYRITNLTSITIPESITEIDNGAFSGCSGLTTISLPKNLTTLKSQTFWECIALKSITLPQNLTSIESSAFLDCSSLQFINIPKGVSVLDENSFLGCTSLKEVIFEDGSEDLLLGYNAFNDSPLETVYLGRNLTYSHSGSGIFYASETLKSLTIGDNVTEVKTYQFENCDNLTSVVMGNGVTKIGSQAFCSCSNLASVEHSASNLVLESQAFDGCVSLKSFDLDGVISIGDGAFQNTGLESIHFPASVQSVGYVPFSGMKRLKTITVAKDFNADLKWGMPNCTAIENITVEEGNTRYDSRENCNALLQKETTDVFLLVGTKKSFIPSGVTIIGPYAFMSIPVSEDIVIPNSVKRILGYAFAGTKPESITCQSVVPPVLEGQVFADVDTSTPLYVPAASISDYSTATGWSEFTNILPIDENIVINDNTEEFQNARNLYNVNITYTRTLPNLEWNSLFVPFEIPVSDLTDYYDVAYINDIHSYDKDFNGEIDQMEMEVIYIKDGTLHANHPYLIRAKNDEAKGMNIVVTDATLYSSAKADRTSIACSSAYTNFEVIGTYEKMSAQELDGCYAINTSGAWSPIASGASLNPFRLYMTITNRDGSPVKVSESAMSRINIRVQGEDNATGITETENGKVKTENFDLSGRRVERMQKGIYIVNGKKVVR